MNENGFFIYIRDGIECVTPSIDVALNRRDSDSTIQVNENGTIKNVIF